MVNNKVRIIGITLSVLVLVGLVGVMALTVQRAQQLTSTITRPKATAVGWPECAKTGTVYNYDGPLSDLNCCSGVKNDPFACGWPARGWCMPSQCPDTGGQQCSLYWYNSGSGCYYAAGSGNCRDANDCNANEVCTSGKCTTPPQGTYTATSPVGGIQVNSLTPTFTWAGNPTGVSYQNFFVSQNSSCNYDASTGQWIDGAGGLSNRSLTLTTPLKPNTTYYWEIYGQPGNPAPTTGCQSFKTGAGTQPIACGSATISSNTISSGGSVTITGTATENAVGFTYGFYNLDNLYGPNNPKPIFFDGNTQYAPSHTVSPRTTDTLTVNFADIDRPDNNAGGAKPTRIQVNVFFTDAVGNYTHSDAKCVVQFAVTTAATGCTTDPDCSGGNVCAFP